MPATEQSRCKKHEWRYFDCVQLEDPKETMLLKFYCIHCLAFKHRDYDVTMEEN